MKNLIVILFILFSINSYSQPYRNIPFGNGAPNDTARTNSNLTVFGSVKFLHYSNSDTSKVLGIDLNGNLVFRTNGGGGSGIDSAAYLKKSDTNALVPGYGRFIDTTKGLRTGITQLRSSSITVSTLGALRVNSGGSYSATIPNSPVFGLSIDTTSSTAILPSNVYNIPNYDYINNNVVFSGVGAGRNTLGRTLDFGTTDAFGIRRYIAGRMSDSTGLLGAQFLRPKISSSSGTSFGFHIRDTILNSSTGGYNVFRILNYEASIGSGDRVLMSAKTMGEADSFKVDYQGNIFAPNFKPTRYHIQGGNSFGVIDTFGTNDNFGLAFKINGVAIANVATDYTWSFTGGGATETIIVLGNGQSNSVSIGVSRGSTAPANNAFIKLGGSTIYSSASAGITTNSPSFYMAGTTAGVDIRNSSISGTTAGVLFSVSSASNSAGGGHSPTSGTIDWSLMPRNSGSNSSFRSTSGSATFNIYTADPIYDFTSTYSGICRGFYFNPTVTGMASGQIRAFESNNNSGFGIYASGMASNYFNGSIIYTAPTTTQKSDSVIVIEAGILKAVSSTGLYSIDAVAVVSADANYTIPLPQTFVKLTATLTASRNIVLPTGVTGTMLKVKNLNTSGTFSWSFTNGTVKDAADNNITTLLNGTVYVLEYDGTNWNKLN